MLKQTLYALGFAVLLIIIGSVDWKCEQSARTAKPTTADATSRPQPLVPTISVVAPDLAIEFTRDKAKAEAKYASQIIEVDGIVESVSQDVTRSNYILLAGDGICGVQCFFAQSARLPVLNRGYHVVIVGVYDRVMFNVTLRKCELKIPPPPD